MSNVVEFRPRARPSRRKPRRDDAVTYRVRVELEGAAEPLWRRLEQASDMFLDDVPRSSARSVGDEPTACR